MSSIQVFKWTAGSLYLLDQTQLPFKKKYIKCSAYTDVAEAIKTMKVRGAPAIAIAAAYGVALAARRLKAKDAKTYGQKMEKVFSDLLATRPTAVNLRWAIDHLRKFILANPLRRVNMFQDLLLKEAKQMEQNDKGMNQHMGKLGAEFIRDGDTILTYCNTGSLATGGYGTALGVIRAAWEAGKRPTVWVDETRPVLQGARLTAWELDRLGIPATLVADVMAGSLMAGGEVDCVVVGADRIAANGDVANKVGTYGLAVLSAYHGVPFYVAAPVSTVDLACPDGAAIPVEQRPGDEVRFVGGQAVAPAGVAVENRAFDVTPASLVTAIVTDQGVARPPYPAALAGLVATGAAGSAVPATPG